MFSLKRPFWQFLRRNCITILFIKKMQLLIKHVSENGSDEECAGFRTGGPCEHVWTCLPPEICPSGVMEGPPQPGPGPVHSQKGAGCGLRPHLPPEMEAGHMGVPRCRWAWTFQRSTLKSNMCIHGKNVLSNWQHKRYSRVYGTNTKTESNNRRLCAHLTEPEKWFQGPRICSLSISFVFSITVLQTLKKKYWNNCRVNTHTSTPSVYNC